MARAVIFHSKFFDFAAVDELVSSSFQAVQIEFKGISNSFRITIMIVIFFRFQRENFDVESIIFSILSENWPQAGDLM